METPEFLLKIWKLFDVPQKEVNYVEEYYADIARKSVPSKSDMEQYNAVRFQIKRTLKEYQKIGCSKPLEAISFNLNSCLYFYRKLLNKKKFMEFCIGELRSELNKQKKTHPQTKDEWIFLSHMFQANTQMEYELSAILLHLRICYDNLAVLIKNISEKKGRSHITLPTSMSMLLSNWERYCKEDENKSFMESLKEDLGSFNELKSLRDRVVHHHERIQQSVVGKEYIFHVADPQNRHILEDVVQSEEPDEFNVIKNEVLAEKNKYFLEDLLVQMKNLANALEQIYPEYCKGKPKKKKPRSSKPKPLKK